MGKNRVSNEDYIYYVYISHADTPGGFYKQELEYKKMINELNNFLEENEEEIETIHFLDSLPSDGKFHLGCVYIERLPKTAKPEVWIPKSKVIYE